MVYFAICGAGPRGGVHLRHAMPMPAGMPRLRLRPRPRAPPNARERERERPFTALGVRVRACRHVRAPQCMGAQSRSRARGMRVYVRSWIVAVV